jgi:WD40 repeat protein
LENVVDPDPRPDGPGENVQARAFRYDAFISYSRKDREFAAKLEKTLKSYRPPKDLPVPQRFLRVFRDEEDLTGVEYHASIESHLKDSAKLVLVCSPQARRSAYVNDEIVRFARSHDANDIIPVLLAGIPNNQASDDQESDKAFPEALCQLQRMPLVTSDFRRIFAGRRDKVHKGAYEGAWHALLANLYNRQRSEIEQREKKRQAGVRKLALGAATAILVVLSAALVYALISRQEAVRQRGIAEQKQREAETERELAVKAAEAEKRARQAEEQQRRLADERRQLAESRQLAAGAMAQLGADPEISVLLAVEAARISPTAEAQDALRKALPDLYLQKTFRAHQNPVTGAQLSPDGRVLVTADGLGYVGFWDARSGKLKSMQRGHQLPIWQIVFNPNGALAVTTSWDRTAAIWNIERGKEVARITDHADHVTAGSFSADGKLLVTAGTDRSARLWEIAPQLKALGILTHEAPVVNVAFSRDGEWIITASGDDTVQVWAKESLKPVYAVKGALSFPLLSRDDRWVIIPRAHQPPLLWDLAESRLRAESGAELARMLGSGLDPKSRFVVTHRENVALVWDALSGKTVAELRGHGDKIRQVQFSPDGNWLVTASADRTARLWATRRWVPVATLKGHSDGVHDAQFSPDGKSIVTAGDSTARLWEVDGNRPVIEFNPQERDLRAVSVSPRGDIAIAASINNTVSFWIVRTGESMPARCRHERPVLSAEFSSDQKLVVSASFDKTARVWTWTPFACSLAAQLSGHGAEVASATFSPDPRYVATASGDGSARIWQWSSQKLLRELRGHARIVSSIAYSRDGARLVTASADGTARVWHAGSGALIALLKHHRAPVQRARFSRDGRFIATASLDHSVSVWEARDGKLVAELKGHQGPVRDAVFNVDGKFLLSVSDDGRVRLWETETWGMVGQFVPQAPPAAEIALTADNQSVLLAESDGRVRVYAWERIAPLAELLKIAKLRLKRPLSGEEKRLFYPASQP